jgi:osmotically-inducible protein OsmY
MPDRYRGDYNRDRRYGGDQEPRREGFRGGFGRPDYGDTANRGYPPLTPKTDRDENYFGSGRMGYGDGIEDYEPNLTFGSSWRDSAGESNYDYPERRYESAERRAGFGRDAYGLGYGGDWEPEGNRRRQFENTRPYERGFYRQSGHRPSQYPSSERGFETGPYGDERGWWDRASDEVSSWFGDKEAERRREMDARGGHRGRGPKNYTRSDERIKEDISDRLSDHDYIDASDIEVEVKNSEAVLSGTVDSRYEKRLAEDIADNVAGVRNVENRLRIRREQRQYAGGDWAYADTAGHTDINRAETAATHTNANPPEKGQARGKTTSG